MTTILFSESPIARFAAEVVTENDCSYFYLYQMEPQEQKLNTMAACWIKNHVVVEEGYSPKVDMDNGLQPKFMTKYCRFPQDLSPMVEEELEIVWGEEGCLAGLYQKGELICVVPYWAGPNFAGYSKYSDTDKMGLYPLPLGEGNAMLQRLESAGKFWQQDFSALWESYQQGYLHDLKAEYGEAVKYYGIDGGNFPPRGLAVFEKEGHKYAFTVGLGMFPQPSVEMYHEDYRDHDHIEMAFCWNNSLQLDEQDVFSQIASIAMIPWIHKTFFDAHHTIDLKVGAKYPYAVFIGDKEAGSLNSEFLQKNQVNLLWLLPIEEDLYGKLTAEEPDYSGVEQIVKKQGISFESL